MYDKEIVLDLLNRMEELTDRIHERFKNVDDVWQWIHRTMGMTNSLHRKPWKALTTPLG